MTTDSADGPDSDSEGGEERRDRLRGLDDRIRHFEKAGVELPDLRDRSAAEPGPEPTPEISGGIASVIEQASLEIEKRVRGEERRHLKSEMKRLRAEAQEELQRTVAAVEHGARSAELDRVVKLEAAAQEATKRIAQLEAELDRAPAAAPAQPTKQPAPAPGRAHDAATRPSRGERRDLRKAMRDADRRAKDAVAELARARRETEAQREQYEGKLAEAKAELERRVAELEESHTEAERVWAEEQNAEVDELRAGHEAAIAEARGESERLRAELEKLRCEAGKPGRTDAGEQTAENGTPSDLTSASVDDLRSLGLSARQAKRVLAMRGENETEPDAEVIERVPGLRRRLRDDLKTRFSA